MEIDEFVYKLIGTFDYNATRAALSSAQAERREIMSSMSAFFADCSTFDKLNFASNLTFSQKENEDIQRINAAYAKKAEPKLVKRPTVEAKPEPVTKASAPKMTTTTDTCGVQTAPEEATMPEMSAALGQAAAATMPPAPESFLSMYGNTMLPPNTYVYVPDSAMLEPMMYMNPNAMPMYTQYGSTIPQAPRSIPQPAPQPGVTQQPLDVDDLMEIVIDELLQAHALDDEVEPDLAASLVAGFTKEQPPPTPATPVNEQPRIIADANTSPMSSITPIASGRRHNRHSPQWSGSTSQSPSALFSRDVSDGEMDAISMVSEGEVYPALKGMTQ